MKAVKKKTTKTKITKAPAVHVERIDVSGEDELLSLPVTAGKKSKKKVVKKAPIPTVTKEPVLIAVSFDEVGVAKVARYAGLFFVLAGACFASQALSGLYVETIELALYDGSAFSPRLHLAQTIAPQIISTTNTTSEPPPLPPTNSETSEPTTISSPPPSYTVETNTQPVEEDGIEASVMQPPARIAVRDSMPLRESTQVFVKVAHARLVELVVIPQHILTERYLGKAKRSSAEEWQASIDTTQLPNGSYRLFARVSNDYGSYESNDVFIRIFNIPSQYGEEEATESTSGTTTTQAPVSKYAEVTLAIERMASEFATQEPPPDIKKEITSIMRPQAANEETDMLRSTALSEGSASATDPVIETHATQFLGQFEKEFNELLLVYGVALRVGDATGIARVKERIRELERQSLDRVATDLITATDENSSDLIQRVRERLSFLVRAAEERTEREERIILDRVGAEVARDSDRDGVSDYDEEHLYSTDPFSGDSDKDGFSDGAEVLSGYDPTDERREIAVAFEDPREVGVLRSDILSIERLDVLQKEETATADELHKVIFSGKALPFSFVTLYIYSTPIVVTVKTDDDGTWRYTFDKELEDGTHEVYVGITDNAGKLIAKSEPFSFVKTAEAYSTGTTALSVTPAPPQQLFSQYSFTLVLSLLVAMMGTLLVLLGAYVARQEQKRSPLVVAL